MPTNLPVEAKLKWIEASSAKDPQKKLRALQEFLSLVPKHKGTARLRSQVKRKIAILRKEMKKRGKKTSRSGQKLFLEKKGAAQVVILGPTNVGRSSLLALLTNAKVIISSYPHTTLRPIQGMFRYKDLHFQLVEAPALKEGSADGEGWGLQTLGLARNADLLFLMVDLSQDPQKQLSMILGELNKARISIKKPNGRVDIKRKERGTGLRIYVLGRLIDCQGKDVEELLRGYKVFDAVIKVYGDATLDDVEDALFESIQHRPAVIIANKADCPNAEDKVKQLSCFLENKIKVLSISCKKRVGLVFLGGEIFEMLDVVRVYTKEPNDKKPSSKPIVLKKGATILELAKQIHSDFYRRFSYAKVWSRRLPFSPQRVGLSFILDDEDVIEIHTR